MRITVFLRAFKDLKKIDVSINQIVTLLKKLKVKQETIQNVFKDVFQFNNVLL